MADVGAARIVAAFASLGAAAIHLASAADHYAEWWAAGVFFYAIGAFQAGWAVAVLRSSGRAVMLLGLLANAGVIATWVVSRTEGMPVGPGAGVPEGITRADATAAVFQAVICVVALWRIRQRPARGFASSMRAVLLVGAASAAVAATTMPAVETAMSHSHSHGTADESEPHGHDGDAPGHEDGDAEPRDTHSGTSPTPSADTDESGAPEPSKTEKPTADEPGHDDEPHGH
ncbi:hypothetical protein U9R90_27975 [Streptomyces sp. E11-3]|uniref:hypothetical protein n=1 Tax=Streptomyces sp. E11-3 TaxID=3110112 RepID=UPI00397FE72A